MESENPEQNLGEVAERLSVATLQIERAIRALEERHAFVCGDVQRIVATAEGAYTEHRDAIRQELERKLIVAEQKIASLQAQVELSATAAVRRTVTASPAQMFSKSGVETVGSLEAGTLDAALTGLSLEQRIAVKSQLARAGLLS